MKKVTLSFILLLSTILSGCQKEEMSIREYTYEVTGGSNSYDVAIANIDGDIQEFYNVQNGWVYRWTQKGTRWLYVYAQNNSLTGSVTVKIYRAGRVVAERTNCGGYSVVVIDGEF